MARLGLVVIGRNEGRRLQQCLASIAGGISVVYVDSGSQDESVALARSHGSEVVELDLRRPFTAARARNEGFLRLLEIDPGVEYVQFLDGDCEVRDGWLECGRAELERWPDVAVVCGRCRERFAGTVYNRLCDMEWDTPVGEAMACGGNALMRVKPLVHVGGFRGELIAGEEPELCMRLRDAGWKILRLDAEMVWHDVAMTRFGQWWRRNIRAGHAYAEVSWLHRAGRLRVWIRETRSNWFWGLLLPAAALLPSWWTNGLSLLLLLGYPPLGLRIYYNRHRRGDSRAASACYALFCMLGKFAQVVGQIEFHRHRLLGRPSVLIEYKRTAEQVACHPQRSSDECADR